MKYKGKFLYIVNLDTNGQFETPAASSQEKEWPVTTQDDEWSQ
jgi:hypothetical protein